MGKSTTQKTSQTNSPPAWAEPLLKQGASEAQNLYNSGSGFHAYSGPTQAGFSTPTLGGMNSLLAATGYTGAPVSNATWQNNEAVQGAKQVIAQQAAQMAQQAAAKPAPAPAPVQQAKGPMIIRGPSYGSGSDFNYVVGPGANYSKPYRSR